MVSDQWLQRQLDSLEYWAGVAEAERLEFEQWAPPPDPSRAQPVEDIRAKPTGCVSDEVLYVDLPSDYYCHYGLDPLPSSENHPRANGVGRRFECSVCKATFSTKQALGGHKTWHKQKRPSPRQPDYTRWDDRRDLLECTECGDLWLRERKRGLKPLNCPQCR